MTLLRAIAGMCRSTSCKSFRRRLEISVVCDSCWLTSVPSILSVSADGHDVDCYGSNVAKELELEFPWILARGDRELDELVSFVGGMIVENVKDPVGNFA